MGKNKNKKSASYHPFNDPAKRQKLSEHKDKKVQF